MLFKILINFITFKKLNFHEFWIWHVVIKFQKIVNPVKSCWVCFLFHIFWIGLNVKNTLKQRAALHVLLTALHGEIHWLTLLLHPLNPCKQAKLRRAVNWNSPFFCFVHNKKKIFFSPWFETLFSTTGCSVSDPSLVIVRRATFYEPPCCSKWFKVAHLSNYLLFQRFIFIIRSPFFHYVFFCE